MGSSVHWYDNDVFRWRTGASVGWSLLLLPPSAGIYTCLAHFSLLHPYQWFIGWLQACFSLTGVGSILTVLTCTGIISVLNAFHYAVLPQIHHNRLSIILSVTRPARLLHTASHALMGGVTAWACCKLVGGRYVRLSTRCDGGNGSNGVLCLNEHHLFLVLFGAFLGTVYSMSYFIRRSNLLTFSIIQQLKFFKVKTFLSQAIFSNTLLSLRLCAYFYVFYYLCGCLFKSWLLSNLRLHELAYPVDSIRGLLDLRLFWQAWILASLLTHFWSFSRYLFKIFNTEVYEFPLETAFSSSQECRLHRALGEEKGTSLVRFLAYQDLSILAEHSTARRRQIFALSDPGGHPHNWTRVSGECLALLASLTDRLTAHQEWAANGLSREQRMAEEKKKGKDKKQRASTTSSYYTAAGSPMPHQRIATLSATTVGSPGTMFGTPGVPLVDVSSYGAHTPGRDETIVGTPGRQGYIPSPRRPLHETHRGLTPQQAARYPVQHHQYFYHLQPRLASLRGLTIFRYFTDVFPESHIRALFTDVQLHIWALEALSSLISASFAEDHYGVVQKTLPDILTEMLALHNALEKLLRLPNISTVRDPRELKVTRIGPAHPDDQLRNDLRTTVKTSLHRIISTFGRHIKSVPLAPEYRKQLVELMDYKQ